MGCSPWGRYQSDTTERLHFQFSLSCIGEGNGNPLQCSCLENPRDGGASWAAIYGVAQSRTQLKQLSSSSSSSSSSSYCSTEQPVCRWISLREGNGNPLQYSCLENPLDRGAWWATVHGVAESDTTERLSLSLSLSHTHTHTQVDFPRLVERINPVSPGCMQPRLPIGLTVFSQGLPRY